MNVTTYSLYKECKSEKRIDSEWKHVYIITVANKGFTCNRANIIMKGNTHPGYTLYVVINIIFSFTNYKHTRSSLK